MEPARSFKKVTKMEPIIVPKDFGCFAIRNSSKLISPNKSRSSSLHLGFPTPPRGRRSRNSNSSASSSDQDTCTITPRISPTANNSNKEDEFKEVFRRFDIDQDGKISALELRTYFGSIGDYMSHEEAEGVIEDLDTDGDKMIGFEEFLKLMMDNKEEDEEEDLKGAFEMFEFRRGSGRITPRSLQKVLSRLGDSKSYDDCVSIIRVFDADGDGELDFNDFRQMMVA